MLELVVCRGRAVHKPAPKRNKTVDALLDPYLDVYKRQTLGVVLPSFFIILLIAAVLKNLMKYAGVEAFLSGVRPCVVAMILATALNMMLSTLDGIKTLADGFAPDARSILVFAVLWVVHFVWKKMCIRDRPYIVVFMNKCDMVDDEELLDLVEMETVSYTHLDVYKRQVQTLLKEIDLDQLSAELTAEVEKSSGQKRVRILKRLEVVEAFRISGNRPEWMVMDVRCV